MTMESVDVLVFRVLASSYHKIFLTNLVQVFGRTSMNPN